MTKSTEEVTVETIHHDLRKLCTDIFENNLSKKETQLRTIFLSRKAELAGIPLIIDDSVLNGLINAAGSRTDSDMESWEHEDTEYHVDRAMSAMTDQEDDDDSWEDDDDSWD